MTTPEALAREEIDRQLVGCGWTVQTQEQLNIMAGLGVAVGEMNLKTGRADYTLYVDGKVIGTIEAKKEGFTLTGVSILYSRPYAAGLRYSQIKDLARRLSIKPFHDALASLVDESQPQTLLKLWQAFGAVEPDKVDSGVEPASEFLARILRERRQRWEQQQLATCESKGKKPPKNWQSKYKEPAAPDTANLPKLPNGWCWAAIEQLNSTERPCAYGVLQPGKQFDGGTKLVRVCDVKEGKIAISQLKEIDPKIADKYQRTFLVGGEVLLTIVGTIGRTAVVSKELAGANIARAVAVLPIIKPISPQYIQTVLSTITTRNRLTSAAHEVARKTLNLEDVRAAVVPIAPVDEQDEIVRLVKKQSDSFAISDHLIEKNSLLADLLRQSILKSAFEGNLTAACLNGS